MNDPDDISEKKPLIEEEKQEINPNNLPDIQITHLFDGDVLNSLKDGGSKLVLPAESWNEDYDLTCVALKDTDIQVKHPDMNNATGFARSSLGLSCDFK